MILVEPAARPPGRDGKGALAKRQAVPVEQRRAEAEAREAEARATAKRVREEAETEATAAREAKRVSSEERAELKAQLNAWERQNGRRLKKADLHSDPVLHATYTRYRELSDSDDGTYTNA